MMFKWLAAVAAVVVVAVPGVAAASDINDGVTEEQMFGSGSAGSLSPMPDCPKLTYFSFEEGTCLPTSSPLPQGTVALATDGTCPVSEDLETAFTTSAEMKTLLECILPKAIDWLSYEYVDASLVTPAEWGSQSGTLLPLDFIYVPAGIAVEEPEGQFQHCGGYDSASALHYCPQDGNIYLGEELLWFTYNEFGDADMWGSISHEMGHRIQHVAGGMKADPAVPNEEIPIENQADCFSGAFMDFAARYGYIDVSVTGDDIVDLFSGLFTIGEADSGQRTHGTIDQRIRAFFVGYNSDDSLGVFECDFYLTDVTIIPATFLEDTQTPGADSTTVPAAATPTTVAPAPTTTLASATTTSAPAPTTTLAPAQPTTTPAAPAGLQGVVQACATEVAAQFVAVLPADVVPESLGTIAGLAAENGVTVPEFVTNSVSGQLDAETGSWSLFDPWAGAEADGDPATEVGWIQGLAIDCGFNSIGATEAQLEQYYTADEGEFAASTFKVTWGFVDSDDGERVFVVTFTAAQS